jgi:hypothetical protein
MSTDKLHFKTKNPAFYAGSLAKKVVRREGIEPATLGLKALVSRAE